MRIARYAFEYAQKHGRKKVTIVHKANVLKALTGLFLECGQLVAKEFEGRIEMNDQDRRCLCDATGDEPVAVRCHRDHKSVR